MCFVGIRRVSVCDAHIESMDDSSGAVSCAYYIAIVLRRIVAVCQVCDAHIKSNNVMILVLSLVLTRTYMFANVLCFVGYPFVMFSSL
jgi:hypothetical protein